MLVTTTHSRKTASGKKKPPNNMNTATATPNQASGRPVGEVLIATIEVLKVKAAAQSIPQTRTSG